MIKSQIVEFIWKDNFSLQLKKYIFAYSHTGKLVRNFLNETIPRQERPKVSKIATNPFTVGAQSSPVGPKMYTQFVFWFWKAYMCGFKKIYFLNLVHGQFFKSMSSDPPFDQKFYADQEKGLKHGLNYRLISHYYSTIIR